MKLEKNWLYQFSISLSILGLLYIIICGVSFFGEGHEYNFYYKGILLLTLFGAWILIQFFAMISARFELLKKLAVKKKWVIIGEWIFVTVILILAFILRIIVIQKIPMQVASDYKTYYEIADLLKQGTIQEAGKGYCNYIAMFPHVMGYCYILKTAFTWFGTSVAVGQYLNIILSVATVFITYRIGRKLGGRITGIIVLLLTAFWPSQVLYITLISAEYVFAFFLFSCILLFLSLVKDYDENTNQATKVIILHMVLGIMIALTAAIRPMAIILLIAIIICILPQKMKLSNVSRNDLPLVLRFIEKGWLRCILIIIPYMLVSSFITTNIEVTINKTLPSSSTSFGYSLLVGLNTGSIGGWNQEDSNLLYDTMKATDSASQVHIVCRNLALARLTSDPQKNFNLFIEKYELLWGNDDYGSTWNISFLQEQGELTQSRSDFLYKAKEYNNIIYMLTVFFALIALIYLLKKKASYAYVLILVYLGTAAMHLFVESQNRYHYHVLEVFIILAGMGIHFIFENERDRVDIIRKNKKKKDQLLESEKEKIEIEETVEKRMVEIRKEVMSNVFDMENALKNNHVTITVSEAYNQMNAQNKEVNEEHTEKEAEPSQNNIGHINDETEKLDNRTDDINKETKVSEDVN